MPVDVSRCLPRSFYERDAEVVAYDLLGTVLVHRTDTMERRVRVVETEAYLGEFDLACHAAAGLTPRTAVMFGPPGHAYVYLVYGMHHMVNVVAESLGKPAAVLIRAGEPLSNVTDRTDGPGRLTRAMGITVSALDGEDLRGDRLWLEPGSPPQRVRRTPRIGVTYSGMWAAAPLRFLDADSEHVSAVPGLRPNLRRRR